jgi:hypothetical protein
MQAAVVVAATEMALREVTVGAEPAVAGLAAVQSVLPILAVVAAAMVVQHTMAQPVVQVS